MAIQYITSGQISSGTTVSSGNTQIVNGGGITSNTIVYSGGSQVISSNGNGYGTVVHSGGSLVISSGGKETGGTIYKGGVTSVTYGGTANITVVYGTQNVYGQASNTTINGGVQTVNSGAIVTSSYVASNGLQTVTSGGTTSITKLYVASQTILNGGVASGTQVVSATQTISSGGISDSAIIYRGGIQTVNNGASAYNTTIQNGSQQINSGGLASNTQISGIGIQTVNSGGSAINTSIYDGAQQIINGGAIISGATIYDGGSQTINSGATVNNVIVSSGGTQIVNAGAITSGTIIYDGANVTISSGATDSAATIYGTQYVYGRTDYATVDGGTQQVTDANGITTYTTVINGGVQTITSSARSLYTTIVSGTQLVQNDAIAVLTTVSNGNQIVINGGITWNTTLYGNGVQNIQSGGNASGTSISAGGTQIANSGGIASNTTIYDGGNQSINSGATAIDTTISLGGQQIINDGGIAQNTTIQSGGTLIISSGGQLAGTNTVSSGGTLTINSGGQLTGTATIENGGTISLYPDTGGTINLEGNNNTGIIISGLESGGEVTTVITTINGFTGSNAGDSDSIKLVGIDTKDVTSVDYVDANGNASDDHVTFTLTNGNKITLNIIGAKDAGYTLSTSSDGSLVYEVCFLPGTMIKTPSGERPVEDIQINDEVITFDWKNNQNTVSKIKWVGSKTINVKQSPHDDEAGYPVRILKNAISESVPHKDLLVTPEHCLFFDGKFIPVRMLVNHQTIYYDKTIKSYTYYHIETENHSVIYSDGMLTESYLDTGNRGVFVQHGKCALFQRTLKAKNWEHDSAAELTVDRSIVEPIYHQISKRAEGLTHFNSRKKIIQTSTKDPNLYLITDTGLILTPHLNKQNKYIFTLPEDVKNIFIHSRTSRPCDTIGSFVDDRRQLGLLIGNVYIITKNQLYPITNHLSQQDLPGWDIVEQTPCRWTNGNAELNIETNSSSKQNKLLVIQVLSSSDYLLHNQESTIKHQIIA